MRMRTPFCIALIPPEYGGQERGCELSVDPPFVAEPGDCLLSGADLDKRRPSAGVLHTPALRHCIASPNGVPALDPCTQESGDPLDGDG